MDSRPILLPQLFLGQPLIISHAYKVLLDIDIGKIVVSHFTFGSILRSLALIAAKLTVVICLNLSASHLVDV